MIKVRRDASGNPVSVTWVGTTSGTFQGVFGQPRNLKDALDLKKVFKAGMEGGGKDTAVVTTTLALDTTAKRDAFNSGRAPSGSVGGAASLAWDTLLDDSSELDDKTGPTADGPFGDVINDYSKTSIVTYEGDRFGLALGRGGQPRHRRRPRGRRLLDRPRGDRRRVPRGAGTDGSRELVPFTDCVS